MNIDKKMDAAWGRVWGGLFCEETNLFYDYLTSLDPEKRFDHLPLVEEIELQCPNPAGWGTGMEDSMLNAGSMIDVLRLRWELMGDKDAPELAEKALAGMCSCSEVHGRDGFVVRSISHRDGKSCYVNSSRDQFTLCVYGAWRFLRSFPDCEAGCAKARKLLVDIAAYCEEVVVRGGSDDLLRLDGKPGLVSTVLNVAVHEIMRLPMFFAAAWDATGDEHWRELYLKYAVDGIEKNLQLDPDWPWWDIELSQMQLSLVLLAEVEQDEELGGKYREAVRLVAELSEKYLKRELAKAKAFEGDWDRLNDVWRFMDFRVRGEVLKRPDSPVLYGGYPHFLPEFPQEYHVPYSRLRGVGNLMYTVLFSRDVCLADDVIADFVEIACKPDYAVHGSDGMINILHGYWVARERGVID